MRLIHYSDEPLVAVRSASQCGDNYDWHEGRKPTGLWVSVEGEDDWRAWCKAEDFRDCDAQVATEIVLRDTHTVLVIDTSVALELFHREYSVEQKKYGKWAEWMIDWPRVAASHGGIIIAPYQWRHRLDSPVSSWYYSWDCASGCLWDASQVERVTRLETETIGT